MTQRIALVTGGTRGIGKAISLALQKAGYQAAATHYSNEEAARHFEQETGLHTFKWDVGDYQACEKGVKEVEARLGPIEILVNNAGIIRDSALHKMTFEQWKAVIHTNLDSCFNMSRAVIESMRERKFGRIINISSINGQKGQMGQTNYAAAKAGILGFTKSLAQETARLGITVNAIAPGYISTEMVQTLPPQIIEKIVAQIPVGRLGLAEEIARTVVFLASEEAGFITGSTVSINGGQYMS